MTFPPGGRAYWIASAAIIGATAGLPGAWMLGGTLSAALFGAIGALHAVLQWKLGPSVGGVWRWLAVITWGAIWGGCVVYWFGDVSGDTWLDVHALRCFHLHILPPDPNAPHLADNFISGDWDRGVHLLIICPLGVIAFSVASVVIELRMLWRRRSCHENDHHRVWFRVATTCALAAACWSAANEAFLTLLESFGTRHPCNPEIGWIGLLGWVVAAWGYRLAAAQAAGVHAVHPPEAWAYRRAAEMTSDASRERNVQRTLRAAFAITSLLIVLQASRTAYLLYEAAKGPDCGCRKEM